MAYVLSKWRPVAILDLWKPKIAPVYRSAGPENLNIEPNMSLFVLNGSYGSLIFSQWRPSAILDFANRNYDGEGKLMVLSVLSGFVLI